MRRYIEQLHKRPDHHKKRFALLASSTITLFIFGIWSLTTFGINSEKIIAEKSEVSPFQSLGASVKDSFLGLRGAFLELKTGLEKINLETEYREMRDNVLDTYDR